MPKPRTKVQLYHLQLFRRAESGNLEVISVWGQFCLAWMQIFPLKGVHNHLLMFALLVMSLFVHAMTLGSTIVSAEYQATHYQ